MFDALRHDFNTRRRERCVRLDFPVQQGQGSIAGLEELEQLLKAAVKASFETRAAAYEEEVIYMYAETHASLWLSTSVDGSSSSSSSSSRKHSSNPSIATDAMPVYEQGSAPAVHVSGCSYTGYCVLLLIS